MSPAPQHNPTPGAYYDPPPPKHELPQQAPLQPEQGFVQQHHPPQQQHGGPIYEVPTSPR